VGLHGHLLVCVCPHLLCVRSLFTFDFIYYWEFNRKKLNSTQKHKTADKLPVWNFLTVAGHCTPTTQKKSVGSARKIQIHVEGLAGKHNWRDHLSWEGQSLLERLSRLGTCHLRQPWRTLQHRTRAAGVRTMAIQMLLLTAASVAIPSGMFGGEQVWECQKFKSAFSSYSWELNWEWKLVTESNRDTVEYFSIVLYVIVNMS
jgi:hypothetical protein